MTDKNEITMYGTGWCGDCTRSKATLARLEAPFRYVDIENDDAQATFAEGLSGSKRIPVIVFADGDVLVEPSAQTLTEKVTSLRE